LKLGVKWLKSGCSENPKGRCRQNWKTLLCENPKGCIGKNKKGVSNGENLKRGTVLALKKKRRNKKVISLP
jgi:hypothetical protein